MRKSNRGLVQNFMPGLQKAFTSANKALEFLKSQGLSYRTQDFYNDWRSYAGYQKGKDTWKKTTYSHKISERWFQPSTAKYEEKYVYKVAVNGYSDIFGEVKNKMITVVSPTNLKVGDVYEEAKKRIEKNREKYKFYFQSGHITDILMKSI